MTISKLWLLPVFLILLAIPVFSQGLVTPTHYYNFSESSGNLLDKLGTSNGVVVAIGNRSNEGAFGSSYYFDGNDHIQLPFGTSDYFHNKKTWFGSFKSVENDGNLNLVFGQNSTTNHFWEFQVDDDGASGDRVAVYTGEYVSASGDWGVLNDTIWADYDDGTWHRFFIVQHGDLNNANNLRIYIDGVDIDAPEFFQVGADPNNVSMVNWVLGSRGTGSLGFIGWLDEIGFVNTNLSAANISYIVNNDCYYGHNCSWGTGFSQNPADSLNITAYSPANNTQFNTNPVYFNITLNTNQTSNCSLYLNSTLNQTTSNQAAGEINFTLQVNFTNTESKFDYVWRCYNGQTNQNSTSREFYIDNVMPSIVSNFTNQSFFFQDFLKFHANFSDSFMLYSYNISIDGTQIAGESNLGLTFKQVNISYDSNLSVGTHLLNLRTADGHTAKELGGDYEVSNGIFNNYLKFDFYDGGFVKIKGLPDSIFDDFTASREIDRYTFNYEPSEQKNNYSFEIESDHKIEIVEKPGYYGGKWLIIDNRKWLDFVLDNEPNMQVDINSVTTNKVEVTVSGLEFSNSSLQFSSIGDLNIFTLNYTFYTTNASITSDAIVLENENQTITFKINKTGSITSTNANFYYNGTNKTISKTSYSNYDLYTGTFTTPSVSQTTNMTINWTFDIYGSNNNESGWLNTTQLVYKIGLDNCSTYSMRAVNFSVRMENNETLTKSDVEGHFRIWVDDLSNYRSFNLTWNDITTGGICIYPNSSLYNVYGQVEYQDITLNHQKKTYYYANTTFKNESFNVTYYLTNGTTQVTFTVTDENDDPVEEAYIKVLSYYLTTDSYKTTEILQTDTDGEALGQIILNSQWYQFIVEYQGVVYLITEPKKLTLTSYNFRINLQTDLYDFYDTSRGIATSLTFNNASLKFLYTFSDTTNSVSSGCLKVIKRTINGDTLINNTCISSAASTIQITLPSPVSDTYIATGTVNINPTFITDTLSRTFDDTWQKFGLAGVLVSFILVLTLVMVGLWNPMVSVILMAVGMALVNILGFFHMNWTFLVSFFIIAGITIYRLNRS